MPAQSTTNGYTIAAVSKLTGVGCHALRVWERRYGYPVPRRSPSGHRRYDAEQVRVLRRIATLLQQGRSIGELMADLRDGRLDVPEGPINGGPGAAGLLVDRLLQADLTGAEEVYGRLAAGLETAALLERVIEPALVDTGERWFRGEGEVYQERCASGFLRRKLNLLLEQAQRANARPRQSALVGTMQGDRHEGGVLMLCILLELAGWRALYLGVDLPAREFAKAVEAWRPDTLAVSFVLSRNINKRFQELSRIRGVPIFVGGRSILNYQALARRHGLHPLPGPATATVPQLIARLEQGRSPPDG